MSINKMLLLDITQHHFCSAEVLRGVRAGRKFTHNDLTGAFTLAAPAPMVTRLPCCSELNADAGFASARAFLYCSNFAIYSAWRMQHSIAAS